jgi:hypothetical protein
MAVRKVKAEAQEIETQGILHDEMYDAKSLNPALEMLYDEMGITDGGDATVHISKLDADMRGNEANVWRGDPDSYDLEQIAKTFGSGAYRVKVYVRNPDGRKPCLANKIFFWKLSPADERKIKEAVEAPIEAKPAAQSGNDLREMFTGLATMMQENTKQMIEALRTRETNPMQTLEGIKQLAEIMRPASAAPVAPGMDIMSTLAVATKLIDLSKGMNPAPLLNADGEVSSGAVLMKALDVFGQTIAKAQSAQAPGAVEQPAPESPQTITVSQQEVDEMNLMFKMQLKMANAKAANGADPEEVANEVWDYAPDDVLNALLTDPLWFAKLCEIEPECAKYQVWYESVRGHLIRFDAEDTAAAGLTKENGESIIDGKGNAADVAGAETTIKPA